MTSQVAIDSMFADILSAMQSGATAIVGYVPEMRWQNVEKSTLPDGGLYWIRSSIQTLLEGEAALGNVLFDSSGLVVVQVFGPMSDSQAGQKTLALANMIRDKFRSRNSLGIFYRNARAQPVDPDKSWFRYNVFIEFDFTELRG